MCLLVVVGRAVVCVVLVVLFVDRLFVAVVDVDGRGVVWLLLLLLWWLLLFVVVAVGVVVVAVVVD